MSPDGAALQLTFQGHVATTQDALILFEACLQGHLSHVPRRPRDRERSSLIRSGSVFIFEENVSGIKRWTDGIAWSPSRILGDFLVYRELEKPIPPGGRRRAITKQRRPSRPQKAYLTPEASFSAASFGAARNAQEIERQLIGSLVDSYGFKHDGLVKKTIGVTVQGITHHLISYYHLNDVMSNQLRKPSQTENLRYIRPRTELISKQSFHLPIGDLGRGKGPPEAYGYSSNIGGYVQNNTQQAQYCMPQNHPPLAQQPGASGHGMGVPFMPAPYLQSPVSTPPRWGQQPGCNQDDQSAYSRGCHPFSRPLPTIPTCAPSIMPDRGQTQPGAMYPPMNMPLPMNNLSLSMHMRNRLPHRSSPCPVNTNAPQIDHSRENLPSSCQVRYENSQTSAPQQLHNYPRAGTPY